MKGHFSIFFIIITILLTIFMIINPQASLGAAQDGFTLWYSVLLPALLPFFIVAELITASGFIKCLGQALEAVMRPVFRLPGCASLVIVMGFTSGFPVGAIMSKKLYTDGMLTAEEAERLAAFTNNSSPLFIIGAVGVGLFASPSLGYALASGHYLSNLVLGILLRFKASPITSCPGYSAPLPQPSRQFTMTGMTRPSPGKLLSEAIKNSLNNIIAIAGFVIIFSVLTRMLILWGFLDWVALAFMKIFSFFHLPYSVAYGLGMGLFEISIGTKAVSLAPQGDIWCKLLAVSSILAFSGFSIIAQVTGILADTPVRPAFYLCSRLIQVALALPITAGAYYCLVRCQAAASLGYSCNNVLYSFDAWRISLDCLWLGLIIMGALLLVSLSWSHD